MKAIGIFLLIALLGGCATVSNRTMRVQGESVLLAGTNAANLCFDAVVPGTFTLKGSNAVTFVEGADFAIDFAAGKIWRTPQSRIPDYTTYPLYGLTNFDHSKFKDFSNSKWFVWAGYTTRHGERWAEPNPQREFLTETRRKLKAGGTFRIISYGDSITAGGDASKVELQFPRRFGSYLQRKFPQAKVEVTDASIPGYTSQQGLEWFDKKVGPAGPGDLVLVGFGMNDHNIGSNEPEKFRTNLLAIVQRIRETKHAEVILFSAFPPNENWKFGTHRMALYADATKQAAREAKCAYVDVFAVWERVLRRKDQSSLLANNVNHPNDFGHWLYEQAFEALEF